MNAPWGDIELFLAVASSGSFSAAARTLGITQPTVSRRIGALEEALGRPLFRRDVEGAHLTTEGERLLPAARQMERWATELAQAVANFEDKPEGVVRITAPPGLAFSFLVPFAARLRQDLPGLRLELLTGIEHIDLSRGEADLAMRTRAPNRPDLVAALIASAELGAFVSTKYQKQLPCPARLADLDWITWSPPHEHLAPRPTLEAMIANFAPAFASNDYVVQERAVAEGIGAMILMKATHPSLPFQNLVEVPVQEPLPQATFHLVCAKTMRFVPRVAAVIDELSKMLDEVDGLTLQFPDERNK